MSDLKDEVDIAHAFDPPKRGAGRNGRPGPRVATAWCFLCRKAHTVRECPKHPQAKGVASTDVR